MAINNFSIPFYRKAVFRTDKWSNTLKLLKVKIIIKTMAMKKRPPSMKVTYKNPITDENMCLEIPAR